MRTNTTAAKTATASKTSTSTTARKSATKGRQTAPATIAPKITPPASTVAFAETSATYPPECVTALVMPEDARWVNSRTQQYEQPPWILAGVLALIGNQTMRDPAAALALRSDTGCLLWRAIYRKASDYTDRIPVYVTGDLYCADEDSKQIGRDVSDWLGTLIHFGIKVMEAGASISFMTRHGEFRLLAESAAFDLIRFREEGTSESEVA